MAEEQMGTQRDLIKELAPWTKLFVAFKVALDPKKLVLAGGGIFVMALGWWLLAVIFFSARSAKPEWNKYNPVDYDNNASAAWKAFTNARHHWNLLYIMAGSTEDPERQDVGDVAESPEDYENIEREKEDIRNRLSRLSNKLAMEKPGGVLILVVDDKDKLKIAIRPQNAADADALERRLQDKKLQVRDLHMSGDGKNLVIKVGDVAVVPIDPEKVKDIKDFVDGARTFESIQEEIRTNTRSKRVAELALMLQDAPFKPHGRLRTLPWFEDRGPNPYLLLTGEVPGVDASGKMTTTMPWTDSGFFRWLLREQVPVLLEPLVKFFRPIIFMMDPAAGFWNRVYLFLVILWSLATWAFFGGAITRIAVVQVAKTNERVSLAEAAKFVITRYKSYLLAPLLPLAFLAMLTVGLFLLGVFEVFTFALGDVVVPILWPLVLIIGLIMAVVLVGLVGWPLMYSTISAEGSDSFDAISRSYSYVYQAPWQYLWYSFVAICYGAVVVFFVSLMGSLTVYASKWAFSLTPTPEKREMSYLFRFAPTSYGWRDLLLAKSPNAVFDKEVNTKGQLVVATHYRQPTDADMAPNLHNNFAGLVIALWLYIVFLLVVGFSYSYFWTAAPIIYLLMRQKVDDTELDEIHLEEEPEPAFLSPTPPPAEPKGNTAAPQMVEAPQLRMPAAPPASPLAPPVEPLAEPAKTDRSAPANPAL